MIVLLMVPFVLLGFVVVVGEVFEMIYRAANRRAEISEQLVIMDRFSIPTE